MDADPPSKPSIGRLILSTFRRTFVSGVLVTVPVIITILILNFLFRQVDGILSPLVSKALGRSIPGMGLAATLALIIAVGVLARNVVGSRLFGLGELLFVRTPLVRAVYSAAKQLVEAVALPQRNSFKRAVLFEYPRRGTYVLGFAAARTHLKEGPITGDLVAVFVPSTPTPVTGFVIFVPANEVYELAIPTEDIVKMIVSGGITTPAELLRAPQSTLLTETATP
ncbi:MAG: DUF502 domain-containing protein [Candidatus Zixiibacteriota bacterium]